MLLALLGRARSAGFCFRNKCWRVGKYFSNGVYGSALLPTNSTLPGVFLSNAPSPLKFFAAGTSQPIQVEKNVVSIIFRLIQS